MYKKHKSITNKRMHTTPDRHTNRIPHQVKRNTNTHSSQNHSTISISSITMGVHVHSICANADAVYCYYCRYCRRRSAHVHFNK